MIPSIEGDIGIAVEYEKILLGKQKLFSRAYNEKGVPENMVLPLFRYVFGDLLGWTPEMVRDYMSFELLEFLKLDKLVKHVNFPPELKKEKDTFYLAAKMYPKQVRYSHKYIVVYVYEDVLNKRRAKFPRNFFENYKGYENAIICLNHAISKIPVMTIRELYDYFRNKKKVLRFLKEMKLYDFYMEAGYDYPIDYLHDSLSAKDKDEFYYRYCKFLDDFASTEDKIKKAKQKDEGKEKKQKKAMKEASDENKD